MTSSPSSPDEPSRARSAIVTETATHHHRAQLHGQGSSREQAALPCAIGRPCRAGTRISPSMDDNLVTYASCRCFPPSRAWCEALKGSDVTAARTLPAWLLAAIMNGNSNKAGGRARSEAAFGCHSLICRPVSWMFFSRAAVAPGCDCRLPG